jgi:predicted RNase H-like nuclease (RuvC/YqgF family)
MKGKRKTESTSNDRLLLIGGIDVGHHTSIALLNLSGGIVCLDTLIHPTNSQTLDHITDFGNVLVLSTDRAKPPSQMKKIASSISAKLVLPAKNMTKKKKRLLILDFLEEEMKMNDHEKAALASAIFAYKKFRPSFKKLRDRLEKNGNANDFEKSRNELFLRMVKDISWVK